MALAILATLNPMGFLIVGGFIVALFICVKFFLKVQSTLVRKFSGWEAMAKIFPPPNMHKTGEKFQAGGYIGGPIRFTFGGRSTPFAIEPAHEGLLVTPNFAPDTPIFISWTGIREVSWVDEGRMASVLTVKVESERTLLFYLPREAVPVIQKNVPPDRFHKESLGDLISNRLHGRG